MSRSLSPQMGGIKLHLPPGQWWSEDGWLDMVVERVIDGTGDGDQLADGWVWVAGTVENGVDPVDSGLVPVRREALATPDAGRYYESRRERAARWLVLYLQGVSAAKLGRRASGGRPRWREDTPVTRLPGGDVVWKLNGEPK